MDSTGPEDSKTFHSRSSLSPFRLGILSRSLSIHCLFPLSVLVLPVLILMVWTTAEASATSTSAMPDLRLILQTQAGLSAYATITSSISLDLVRPLFSKIDIEAGEYILGEYILSGRTDKVKLAIGKAGWAIAWHTRDYASQHLYDCATFNGLLPSRFMNRPEIAITEVAAALGITDTTASFYDFRNPQANNIILHWLFLPGTGTQTATIDLPLGNTYIERGYVFCTALSNSKFWLNNELIDQQGSVWEVVFRWGSLRPDQLRAGQTNVMKIEDLTIFGYGFVGGVSAVYSGTTAISTSGGYRRDISLTYPTILGEPLTVYQTYIPIVHR